ncbi:MULTISPECIES: NAD(P)/FAD-dependent oxidoreductase [Bacillaceae]|uniref:NAD(P)/FAD-dependent oxidoreductase n=1 Tax=Bacillaceae TaxID=186817 RepID=UPI001E3BE152|nr:MULTISPECIES: NAD(P)/FAD-dependent oxidoreductase [Bacillaceae]MCE4049231.1 NAD(P)/FAD-dependent oxidoreductase [Bacillus sp. Au-Bac7]UPO90339.1 NAD(P)/FAD-dependent oxidoreductase [Niallia sp. Man26]
MLLDCVVVGGGPAGLNAALVLGRAKKKIILFDENKPRNAVTHESHGFITRDKIKPSEFKQIALEDLKAYPEITIKNQRVYDIKTENDHFVILTSDGLTYQSRKIILATGLKDILPNIKGIHDYYGTSIFSCPFCDGWELKDRPLVVISENERAFHITKMIYNWSKDVVVCTNGKAVFTNEQKQLLANNNIELIEEEIEYLEGDKGQLRHIILKSGREIARAGGFVTAGLQQASPLAQVLGCSLNNMGGIETDNSGRTNIAGVYACGDNAVIAPAQLIVAAAEGSKAAMAVVGDLVNEDF